MVNPHWFRNPKILGVIGVVILCILFNASVRSPVSEEQQAYDAFVGITLTQFRNPNFDPQKAQPIEIAVEASSGAFRRVFKTEPNPSDKNDKVVRLASLLREAQIFTKSRGSGAEYRVSCTAENKTYTAFFYQKDIEVNPPLSTFMKLSEIFSGS